MEPQKNRRPKRPASKRYPPRTAPQRGTHALARPAPWKSLAGVGLVALAGFLLVGLLLNLGRCSETASVETAAPAYVSPYDWAGLSHDGDRLTYSEGGETRSQVGVDVSDHQGDIDWQAVAADGIDFAFVRVGNRGYTEGGLSVDGRFVKNVEGAEASGLEVGTYFFSQAVSVEEAREEADLVLSQLNGRALSLPVVFDHEPVADAAGRANNLDRATLTACAVAFCERIEAAGYRTMIYGNKGDMARYERASLGDRPVWFAEYDAVVPSGQFDFAIWQYTNGGSVAGISTAVDLNLRFTDAI